MNEHLENLAYRLGVEPGDKLVSVLWEDAKNEVLNYCNRSKVQKGMEVAIRNLAIVYYNRMGSEGESSRSEGGISRTFETGIPLEIKQSLARFRVAKVRRF